VAICGTHLSAVCDNRVKSSISHFSSTIQSQCSRRRIFLKRDFTSVSLFAEDCLGLNYISVVSVCHTISWHYSFNMLYSIIHILKYLIGACTHIVWPVGEPADQRSSSSWPAARRPTGAFFTPPLSTQIEKLCLLVLTTI
jgi:hypothetical protein